MKTRSMRRSATAALALSLTLSLAACGGDDEGDEETTGTGSGTTEGSDGGGELSGTLNGAGSSAQQAAMQAWQAGFQGLHPDVTVNYEPSGSGAGREQFIAGAVPFAGSDAYLDEEELAGAQERCGGGEVLELPLYISPIAVAFNLEGVDSLNLTPEVIAGIFGEQITTWNDPAIAEANPDATLPDLAITPVHRSDESGTTENFVEYLSVVAPDVWTYEPSGDWPAELGGEAAQGTSGVVQAIQGGTGTIGYADASQVGDLGTAAVGVGEEFVEYSPEAAARVVEVSPQVEGRGEGSLALDLARDTAESGAYPIVLVSYELACAQYENAEEGELVSGFLEYVASEEGQQAAAEAAGSAPISDTLREEAMAAIEMIGAGS